LFLARATQYSNAVTRDYSEAYSMDEHIKKTDIYVFLGLVSFFTLIGFIFIYSSSSAFALEKHGSASYFVKKQLLGCILGVIGLLICQFIPLDFIKKQAPLIFCLCLGATALTVIPGIGQSIHGSHRWIYIKGLSLQPSEFLKMAFIIYLAYLLTKKQYRLSSFLHGFLPLLAIVGITSLVLLKQPDFGQTITLCITAFMLFFIAHCQTVHLVSTLAALIPAAATLVLLKPYRLKRILTFLNPWDDPQGAGYQIIQSLIAIGSGHIAGVGIAHSKQKFFYLPMQCTDFIFSIIAEETGLLGSSVIIALYILFLYVGIKIALKFNDLFSFYTTLGFVLLTSLQAVINLFVATGLLPTKGLGLPFISYGLSALLSNFCMVGLILNCMRKSEQ
jgi:cell division protein FtsW